MHELETTCTLNLSLSKTPLYNLHGLLAGFMQHKLQRSELPDHGLPQSAGRVKISYVLLGDERRITILLLGSSVTQRTLVATGPTCQTVVSDYSLHSECGDRFSARLEEQIDAIC